MTEEELRSIIEIPACARSDFPMLMGASTRLLMKEQTRRALFDKVLSKEIFPDIKVVFIGTELTALPCVWGKLVLKKLFVDAVEQDRQARPIRFIEIKGANHFVCLLHIVCQTNTK
jgi:hypothetical protein